MEGNPVYGAGCLVRGGKLLGHPRLRPFVIVPLAVNVLLFGALIGWGLNALAAWVNEGMAAWIPEGWSLIKWILWPLIGIAIALVTGYAFTAVALFIASPFNALLAEKAEELLTNRPAPGLERFGAALINVPRGMVRELTKLLHYLPVALFVLLVSAIPAVNALPPGYDEHADAVYPVLYMQGHSSGFTPMPWAPEEWFVPGYEPGHPAVGNQLDGFYEAWTAGDLSKVVVITFRDANPFFDTSYSVNSANVGPYRVDPHAAAGAARDRRSDQLHRDRRAALRADGR